MHDSRISADIIVGNHPENEKEWNKMAKSSNNLVNPNAREAMNRFKMEAASEVGVPNPVKFNIYFHFWAYPTCFCSVIYRPTQSNGALPYLPILQEVLSWKQNTRSEASHTKWNAALSERKKHPTSSGSASSAQAEKHPQNQRPVSLCIRRRTKRFRRSQNQAVWRPV